MRAPFAKKMSRRPSPSKSKSATPDPIVSGRYFWDVADDDVAEVDAHGVGDVDEADGLRLRPGRPGSGQQPEHRREEDETEPHRERTAGYFDAGGRGPISTLRNSTSVPSAWMAIFP